MKKIIALSLAAGLLFTGLGWGAKPEKPAKPEKADAQQSTATNAKGPFKTEMDKVSYCIGLNEAMAFKSQSIDINVDLFMKGVKDMLGGKKLAMSEDEIRMTLSTFSMKMQQKQREEYQKTQEKNRTDAKAFLDANKDKKGVITTPSGLQYKIIKEGSGRSPRADEMIEVGYEGKLLDGTVFDSSYERGQPALFQAQRLIPGWQEALVLMKSGSEWELYIPSNLAYGERGKQGSPIGPDAMLIFKVELISIKSNMPPPPSMRMQGQQQGQPPR